MIIFMKKLTVTSEEQDKHWFQIQENCVDLLPAGI